MNIAERFDHNYPLYKIEELKDLCDAGLLKFKFVDETPIPRADTVWYVVQEIGKDVAGDMWLFTLNQLTIIE